MKTTLVADNMAKPDSEDGFPKLWQYMGAPPNIWLQTSPTCAVMIHYAGDGELLDGFKTDEFYAGAYERIRGAVTIRFDA